MIDLHCHVLPGVDDGPDRLAGSLELCRAAYAAGTRTVVATPHVSWRYPDVDAATVRAGVSTLNKALSQTAIELEVLSGAEITLSRAAELPDRELDALRLGAGRCVLVEMPSSSGAAGIENATALIADRGYDVVIAHPERSPALQRNPELLERLVEGGALCCVTARALTGHGSHGAPAFAWELIEAQLVHLIASDAHDAVRRPPDLVPELQRAGLAQSQIDYFTVQAPLAVIQGATPPAPPVVTRSRFSWLRGLAHRASAAR
ncbi:MAG: CpsB/CapC family capsule biosynthesis tyrosine phosphatase [Solirubrobacteraceae bacterium]